MNKKFIAPLAVSTAVALVVLLGWMAEVADQAGFARLDPKEGWLLVGRGWLAIAGYAGVFLGFGTAMGALGGYLLGGQFWRWREADLDAQLAVKRAELEKERKLVEQERLSLAKREGELVNTLRAAVTEAIGTVWPRVEAAETARRQAQHQAAQLQQRLLHAQAKAGRLKDQLKRYAPQHD